MLFNEVIALEDDYGRACLIELFFIRLGHHGFAVRKFYDGADMVVGARTGRESESERTMAINLGLAIEDMAVAPEVYRRAKAVGLGTLLSL